MFRCQIVTRLTNGAHEDEEWEGSLFSSLFACEVVSSSIDEVRKNLNRLLNFSGVIDTYGKHYIPENKTTSERVLVSKNGFSRWYYFEIKEIEKDRPKAGQIALPCDQLIV